MDIIQSYFDTLERKSEGKYCVYLDGKERILAKHFIEPGEIFGLTRQSQFIVCGKEWHLRAYCKIHSAVPNVESRERLKSFLEGSIKNSDSGKVGWNWIKEGDRFPIACFYKGLKIYGTLPEFWLYREGIPHLVVKKFKWSHLAIKDEDYTEARCYAYMIHKWLGSPVKISIRVWQVDDWNEDQEIRGILKEPPPAATVEPLFTERDTKIVEDDLDRVIKFYSGLGRFSSRVTDGCKSCDSLEHCKDGVEYTKNHFGWTRVFKPLF